MFTRHLLKVFKKPTKRERGFLNVLFMGKNKKVRTIKRNNKLKPSYKN